jgi:hypothetical protein
MNRAEHNFETRVRKYIARQPHCWVLPKGSQVKGVHDVICCIHGWFVSIELKRDDNQGSYGETKAQAIRGRQIMDADGIYRVIDNMDDLVELIKSLERK